MDWFAPTIVSCMRAGHEETGGPSFVIVSSWEWTAGRRRRAQVDVEL